MKLLFLGGTSYLGREIIKRLQDHHEISVLVRSEASCDKLASLKTTAVFENQLKQLPLQDIIFNLVVDYGKNKDLSEVLETNVDYPLRNIGQVDFKTVINFSSGLDKNVSHYAFSKRTLEEKLSELGKDKKKQILNLRLQHFFGPGAPAHNFITFLITKMLAHEELDLTDCQQKRDFIFTDDLIDAVLLIMEHLSEMSRNEVIEIGSGKSTRLQDVVEMVFDLTHSRSKLNYGKVPRRENEPGKLVANIEKIKKLGWSPKTTIETGLKKHTSGIKL